MRTYTRLLPARTLFCFAALPLAACDVAAPETDEAGLLTLSLTSAPANAQCLHVLATRAETTSTRAFSLVPGQSTTVTAAGLPTGALTVAARAFATACGNVTSATTPTWITESPVAVTLTAGVPVDVTLKLRPAGHLNVTADFDASCDVGQKACAGACIPTSACCTNADCTAAPDGVCAASRCSYAVRLPSEPFASGIVRSDGTGLAGSYGVGEVSDNGTDLVTARNLLTFPLGTLPSGAVIKQATVGVYQNLCIGNPYPTLGQVIVEHVSFPAFSPAVYGAMPSPGDPANVTLSTNAEAGWKTADVTAWVIADQSGSGRAQLRARWTVADGVVNGVVQRCSWIQAPQSSPTSGDRPYLDVRYELP